MYKLAVARSDMAVASDIAGRLVDLEMHDRLWVPLQDACIIAYARPFSGNRPFGPLDPSFAQFDDDDLQALHEALLEMRNKTIAHSDSSIRNVFLFPPGSLRFDGGRVGSGFDLSVRTEKLPPRRFHRVQELCHQVGSRLNAAVQALQESINPEEVPNKPFDLLTLDIVVPDG
ncbi:MAG TPA: hypothetical protein VE174_03580 [Actinomycetota bacterium]|nr:hypothetical protein [Actinomycetota bacterium]